MNKPEFTPGPWEVEVTEDGHIIRMGEAIESPYDRESHLEINYNHGCFYDDCFSEESECNQQALEAEANAFLISAAPDMYEALVSQLKLFDELHKRNIIGPIDHKTLTDELKKVLAKARGESHE